MLDRNALIRWLSALLGCALALGSYACESTETGNPPVVTESFLQYEAADEGLLIIGAPGAVLPGGSWIEVTDLTTDLRASVQTEKDGSFRLLIIGGKGPHYAYRVWNRSGSSEVVTMSGGPREPAPARPPEPQEAASVDSAVAVPSPEAGPDEPLADAGDTGPRTDAGAAMPSDDRSDPDAALPSDVQKDAGAAIASDAAVIAAPGDADTDAAQPEQLSWPCIDAPCSGPVVVSATRDQ